jgi:flagellar motor switch/type III secretory pathway protein FliN
MTEIVKDRPNELEALTSVPKIDQAAPPRLDAFFSIPVTVELVLASLKMPVAKLMEIHAGSEIDLDHPAGAEVSLLVNGCHIAFGHLFLIDPLTKRVGLRISRLASNNGVA